MKNHSVGKSSGLGDRERFLIEGCSEHEAPFGISEYRSRWERLRTAMDDKGLDVLFLSSPESMCWVSGFAAEYYQAQSPMTEGWHPGSGIAVHVNEEQPIHIDIEDELILARITSVVEDLRIHMNDSEQTLLEFVVGELDRSGWLGGMTVGLEMWSNRPNRVYSERFQLALEARGAKVVDSTGLIRAQRRIKSSAELAYIRTAQKIADIGMRAAQESIAPGVTELEVYGEIVRAMASAGGENPGITMPVVSGPKSACIHGLASRRTIMPGDIVNVDVSGVYNRYHANMARSFSVGEPSAAVAERCRQVSGAPAVAQELIRPGLAVQDFLDGMVDYYRDEGILDEAWWVGGYELGISFPPDWVGEFSFALGTDPGEEAFVEGDVCNFEANFYLPENAGATMSINTMMFAGGGANFINGTPSELIVVDA